MKLVRILGAVVAVSLVAVAGVAAFAYATDTKPDQTGWPYDLGGGS